MDGIVKIIDVCTEDCCDVCTNALSLTELDMANQCWNIFCVLFAITYLTITVVRVWLAGVD